MKLKTLLTTLAAAVGLTTAAQAATPTVVWDRDFDTTTKIGTDGKTYTFAANGNGVENGIISVTQAYGATVTFPEQNANGYTVIIRYSNLSAISDRMPIFAGFATDYKDASDYGVAASANGGLGLSGYWFERSDRYAFGTVPTLAEGSGYVVMAHKISNNMKTYAGATLAEATGATCGLKFSSGNATAIGLGGASKDSSSATCGLTGWNNGLRIEAVAIFAGQFYAATDVANYKFPSECGIIKNARWGNIGDATTAGVATKLDGGGYTSFTMNLSKTDDLSHHEIGGSGKVKISKIRMFRRQSKSDSAPQVTITQGSKTIVSSSQTEVSGQKIYGPTWPTKTDNYWTMVAFDAVFTSDEEIDTSADFTISFASTQLAMVQPAASGAYSSATSAYSPAIEITGDYTVARRSISINFNSGAGSVSGTYGVFPSSTWNNFTGNSNSSGATANVSDGSTVTVKWWSKNVYSWGGSDVDAALRGYLDDGACGDGATSNGPHIGITGIPFANYDVIIYHASDTEGYGFNPAAISEWTAQTSCGSTSLSYDGLTSATRNDKSLVFGGTQNKTAIFGKNVSYLKKGFSYANLDIKGGSNSNSARGGIAAIQIVEAFPSDYAASVDAATATWSTQDGLTAISGRPDGENTDSSTLTLSNTTQDDATVNFDTSAGYKTIAVSSASGKSTTLTGTIPAVGSNYEIGGLATLTYVPDKPITILSGGKLTLANTTAGTQSKVISGDGALDIAGPVTLSTGNTFKGTMTVKNGGTLTMGSASCLNNGNAVTIEQGGVVDNNGKADTCNNFTLAGGTLVNNGGTIGTGNKQMASVTVTDDSTIGGKDGFGLINNGYAATTLTLNENTTLTKTGANSFWLVTTTVNGTGKLAIKQGTINCHSNGSGVNFQDATVELDGGNLEINKAATLKNLSYKSGTLKANAAVSGLTDISGDFDTTSTSCLSGSGALGFADAVAFHDGTIRLNESILTTLGTTKTVTIGDNGILDIRAARAINVASIGTDAKLAVKQQEGETETITITDTTLADGDYIDQVEVLEAADDAVTMPIKSAAVSSGTLTITLDKTVFAYEVSENMTISVIETAVLGEGKTFEEAAQLTITATDNPTITVDKNLHITKFALVGEATLKFNSGTTITAPTISAEDAVVIDCSELASGEVKVLIGTITDASKFTATGVKDGQYCRITATGAELFRTDTGTRTNPVVSTETKDFTSLFVGTTDGDWADKANWRTLTTFGDQKAWTPYTELSDAKKAPALPSHGRNDWRVLFDGNYATTKTVTCSSGNAEGWNAEYAVLNGMNVTISLVKMQNPDQQCFFWVDKDSSLTFGSIGGSRTGTNDLAVEAENGITFTEAWTGGNTFNYYLKGAGTVNYAAGVSGGTHKIAQMDLTVGETAKDCRHVAKQKLVNFGASSSVTFSAADGIVVNLDNAEVTAVSTNETVTVAMPVGTYKIETESDGVYAYVVQYADVWDIVDPLSATLTANAKFSEITTWTDFYGHAGADLTKAHAYKLTAGEFTATLDVAPVDGSTIEVVTGTLALDDADVIAAYTPITVDADATLAVTASGLKASKVTNNGTIAFAGGTSDDPIVITGDADFGVTTLAANTFVKNDNDDNRKHLVTGAGATSYYQMWRNGETGFSDGSALTNLTLVVNNTLWLERVTLTEESNVYLEANAQVILNQINPVICGLSGSGSLTHYSSGDPTIYCKQASTYSGTSSLAFTIGGTEVQTLTGAYTGALTVNEGAKVALGGSAAPSSIVNNGTVEWLKAYAIGESRAFDATLGNVIFTSGITATQTRAEYAQGVASAFTGFPAGTAITLTKLDGTSEELTVDAEGKASSTAGDPQIAGPACLFDVTFTNKENASQFAYKAVSGATLQYDTTATFYDPETTVKDIGVYIKHHPYINGAAKTFNALGDFTAVFVGTMSPTANRIFVHFGSSYYSDAKGIMIASKEGTDKVGVFSNVGSTLTELKDLSVPNAATARHVYIVTKRTNDDGDTVFTIYLDGVKRAETKQTGAFVLGRSGHCGVQVGADFGGPIRTGTYKAVENVEGETGVLNVCRIYDYLLTDDQVTKITTEYPYISEGGLYERSVTGEVEYSATKAWTKSGEETAEYDVPTGSGDYKPSATMTAAGDATITVNTNSLIDTFTFNGSAMSFVKDADGTNRVTVSTAVVNAPVTIRYNVLDLSSAAISLSGNGALTFDFSDFDLASYFADTKVQITGMVDQNDAKITAVNIPTATGRTATFGYGDGEYYLTITTTPAPFIYTIGATEEEGTWTWNGIEVTKGTVDAYPSFPIWKKGDGSWTNVVINRTYFVKEGTMVAGDAKEKTGTVTVDEGATFDFNGQKDGYTTINLNGGALLNNGEEMGTNSRQIEGIALSANSTIGGTGNFGMSSSSHHDNTLDLGGFTLAKKDANTFFLLKTTVTNGAVEVTGGTLRIAETTTFTEAGLTLGEGTTLDVDHTLDIGAITAAGATIDNAGTITPFTLTGSATLTGNGTWGTNTLASGSVVTVGTNHALTFAGAGTVNVTLTDAEAQGEMPITLFTPDEGAETVVGTIMYNGKDITDKCTISGNQITAIEREAKIGTTYYLTLAEALGAAQADETVTLLKTVTVASLTVPEKVTLDLNKFLVQTTAVVNNGTIVVYDLNTATALKDLDGTLKAGADLDGKPAMFYPQGTTVAHSTEVVESAEHTNNVPTLEVTVPETKTVIWAQGVGPYNKMYVYGDAEFAGDINGGWDTNKLMTVFGVGGALKLNSDVNIGKFASVTAYGTLDLNGKKFIINDTDAILTTITNLVAGTDVTTDKEGYEVKMAESGGYYFYAIAEKPATCTFTLTPDIAGTTVKVYTNDTVEVVAGESGYTVQRDAEVKIVYTAAAGKLFADGTDTKTVTATISKNATIDVSEVVDTPTDAAAKIGTTYYLALDAALKAVQDGETITLIANCTNTATISVSSKSDIKLDLNGYEWVSDEPTSTYGFQIKSTSLTIQDSSEGATGRLLKLGFSTFLTVDLTSSLELKSGTVLIDHDSTKDYPGNGSCIKNEGTLIICGGTVDSTYPTSVTSYDATISPRTGSTTVISGGTLIGKLESRSNPGSVTIPGTSTARFSEATSYSSCVEDGYALIKGSDGYYTVGVPGAKIGTAYYLTLNDAVEAATAGQTVEVLADAVLASTLNIDKAITLDLGNKVVTLPSGFVDGVKVTAAATIQNGTLNSQLASFADSPNARAYALHSYKTSAVYSNLVVNAVNYRFAVYAEGADTVAACYGENDPTTTVNCYNVDVTGNSVFFEVEFTKMNLDADCSGVLKDGEAAVGSYKAAIYSAGNATVTIAGGAYTNTLALLSGNLGGTIVVNGGDFNGQVYSWMDATAHTDYNDDPKYWAYFTLNAGTFTGPIAFFKEDDASRALDSFAKLKAVDLDAPEGYEWKNSGSSLYYNLSKKSDTPSIPESQGAIVPVEGKENTYAVSNTTDTVNIDNLPANATVVLDPSVTHISGMSDTTTIKVVAESTNTTEKVVDITGAFKVQKGTGTTATIVLDKDGSVEIDGDTIPVVPEVKSDAAKPIDPAASATAATVAGHTIPGLTYQLTRCDDLGAATPKFTAVGEAVKAEGTSTTLTDPEKPTTKAFYKIQVTK